MLYRNYYPYSRVCAQNIAGIAWKVGGLRLAIITFLIWILPSATIMCMAAISYKMFADRSKFLFPVLRFVQPIAVGIVAYATYTFARRFLKSRVSMMLAITLIGTLILQNAYAFPILIMMGGIISSALETQSRRKMNYVLSCFLKREPQEGHLFYWHFVVFCGIGRLSKSNIAV